MSNERVLACLSLLLSGHLLAAEGRAGAASPPPPPPDVKRTVDAVVGRWSGYMTATVPGAAPETFGWSMNCKSAALGAGASCTMQGFPSIGAIEQACLVAYDPTGQAVHYMCVTSMGEVHDHKGRWKGPTTIEFEPLAAGLQGERMTETITWTFPDPARMKSLSAITMPDGRAMSFEFDGKRE